MSWDIIFESNKIKLFISFFFVSRLTECNTVIHIYVYLKYGENEANTKNQYSISPQLK